MCCKLHSIPLSFFVPLVLACKVAFHNINKVLNYIMWSSLEAPGRPAAYPLSTVTSFWVAQPNLTDYLAA